MKRTLRIIGAVILGGCAIAAALAFQYGREVRVESRDGRFRSVRVRTDGDVRIVRRLSDSPCVRGRDWGFDSSRIWVDNGCRAVFEYGAGYGDGRYGRDDRYRRDDRYDGNGRYDDRDYNDRYMQGNYRRVVVSSNNGRRVYRHIENCGVELLRTLSDHDCRRGRTWGYDPDGIWVDDGCRAEFAVRIH